MESETGQDQGMQTEPVAMTRDEAASFVMSFGVPPKATELNWTDQS